ncbi:polysaccharide deacetylase family protein [Clostridium sp. YIM B02515]|uniref:Polysaccharide deacetylase family protein n=1 Tax=Clostridium rhizosphaerae TaxID=2803861 RepID=A0ABS1TBK3_9CLOT|nr:polysaccharide deacetylase family protein [Clostridium rhizosphaerae]MBL4936733.1 polysaccharide deacetylase family protein [Clostridium rhizosphaerae]
MIKHKRYFIVILLVLFHVFTLTGCKDKEQIQLLSNKAAELEKNKKDLSSVITELKKTNEDLSSAITELKKTNEELNSEVNQLKTDNKKLTESNNALQKQNDDLKNKQSSSNSILDKTAYLTFDDGPSDNTIKILDILKENNIKATFFVNGHPESKKIYQRIINEKHTIGNHTYSHDYAALYKTIEDFDKDKQKLDDLIAQITGKKPSILRFPGGSNNHVSFSYGGSDFMDKLTKHIKQSGIKYFDWNVDSTDASVATQDKDKIIAEVLKGSKNKKQAIILMHDSSPKTTTVLALPSIISGLKTQGYKFSTLSDEVTAVQFK